MTNDADLPKGADGPSDAAEQRAALESRAQRGIARGPDAVLAEAVSGRALPLTAHDGIERPRRRLATLAAAALVLVVLAGAVAAIGLRGDDDEQGVAAAGGFCDALAAPALEPPADGANLIVYLDPGISPADTAVGTRLEADPRVRRIAYVDQDETLAIFEELFADNTSILENVTPEDLPTSFKVALTADADANAVAITFRRMPGVYEVSATRAGARVLDVLVSLGSDDSPFVAQSLSRGYLEVRRERFDAAQRQAPAQAVEAMTVLVERLDPVDQHTDDDPGAVFGPALATLVRAASTVREIARTECDLTPAAWGTGAAPDTGAEPQDTTTTAPTPDATTTTEPG